MEYLFGPVLSRRLGLSMGVDLLRHKTCNMDCIYCELGRTGRLSCRRERFVPLQEVLQEIREKRNEPFDYLTFAGSGEPTLSQDLGRAVAFAKRTVSAPVAVITNSSLLVSPAVRREVAAADVVLPSLDAASPAVFQKIDRPAQGLKIEEIIQGIKQFRREFSGEIWLEVMLVAGINDHEADLIARVAESTEPDRIQLNTVIRRPAEPVLPLSEEEMLRMLEIFPGAELIPDWDWRVPADISKRILESLSSTLCTLEEICRLHHLSSIDAIKYCKILENDGLITRRIIEGKLCFQSSKDRAAETEQAAEK